MKNLETMINDIRDELRFVYACDTSDGKSIAELNAVIEKEENDGDMTSERRKYLYTLLTRFMSCRADNAVKINALKDTLRSLENLVSVYEVTK